MILICLCLIADFLVFVLLGLCFYCGGAFGFGFGWLYGGSV